MSLLPFSQLAPSSDKKVPDFHFLPENLFFFQRDLSVVPKTDPETVSPKLFRNEAQVFRNNPTFLIEKLQLFSHEVEVEVEAEAQAEVLAPNCLN